MQLDPHRKHPGVSPEWSNLPRRRCDDCGKNYKPARPLIEGQRGFCSDNCRKSYHKHGGAYRKLKGLMEKMVIKRISEIEERLHEDLIKLATDLDRLRDDFAKRASAQSR